MEKNYDLAPAIEALNREDYSSDSAWIEAAADLELKRSNPEFQKVYMSTVMAARDRDARQELEQNKRAIDEAAAKIVLSASEVETIFKNASNEVADGIRKGSISPERMQREIDSRVMSGHKDLQRKKASNQLIKSMLSGEPLKVK